MKLTVTLIVRRKVIRYTNMWTNAFLICVHDEGNHVVIHLLCLSGLIKLSVQWGGPIVVPVRKAFHKFVLS